MAKPAVTDEEFIRIWRQIQSPSAIARHIGVSERSVYMRRKRIEGTLGITLDSLVPEPTAGSQFSRTITRSMKENSARIQLGLRNGVVIVFSDAHFWPGVRTTAYDGLLWAIREFAPKAVICNGDAFDGASISRYPRIGWDNKPSVIQELYACQEYLGEIRDTARAARHNVRLVWTLGNHDARFETRLAAQASEFEGISGFHLKDHFPDWEACWSCWPTDDVVVKHRYKNGIHATHNNTVMSGKSIVTGHLHSLKVTPFNDYNRRPRFGVDTGTLAETDGPQFMDYLEDNPVNWRSGFAILTFVDGELLWPELAHVFREGEIELRGTVIRVGRAEDARPTIHNQKPSDSDVEGAAPSSS